MRSHPSPAPGDNSCALGTVCSHAGGERDLDGSSSSCFGCAEQELTRVKVGKPPGFSRRKQRDKSRARQGLLVVQQGRKVQRSTETGEEGRREKEKKNKSGKW